jgi:beta-glucuronidase
LLSAWNGLQPPPEPKHFVLLMVRPLLALVLLLVALPASAQAADEPPAPIELSDGWTFQPAGDEPRDVTVPHVFDARPLPDLFPGTTATYRTEVTPPALANGFGWALRFEAVRRKARVLVNGQLVAEHEDPYVPFTVPAGALRPGVPNAIEVQVDNRKGPEPREGWWNWGGMTRPVTLVPQGPAVLEHLGLMPRMECSDQGRCTDARILVDGWLVNRTGEELRPWVNLDLRAPHSGARTRARIAGPLLAPGARERVRATVHVEGAPELWAPGSPNRYAATVTTTVGDTIAQVDREQIGLRTVQVRNGHLRLNGQRIELSGASIHEDTPGRGPALTEADMDAVVRDLQAVHANVTRAHYLLNERLLDRLDAAGILVWTQAPIFHRDVLLRTPNQRARALDTVRGTILASRSHPSSLVYSVANELNATPSELPPTQEFLLEAQRMARGLDPTMPIAVDVLAYPSLPFDETYRSFDALGINSYFGWYPGKPERPTGSVEEHGPYLQVWKDRYRDQALVLTEFGAEATKDGPADEKQTFAFQSDYLARMLDVVKRSPADGAIYWTLREFAVKPFWDGLVNNEPRPDVATDSIHNKALIAYDGDTKPAWEVARDRFASTPFFPFARKPAAAPPAPDHLPGGLVALLALLAVAALAWVNLRLFRSVRDEDEPAPGAAGDVVPLRRELDGDDVAVGHDVVAAFEA